jgi:hypothetical protein
MFSLTKENHATTDYSTQYKGLKAFKPSRSDESWLKMSIYQFIQTFVGDPSTHGHGSFKYLLPFILVSTVVLWLLPGLLAKVAGRLVYYFSRRVLRGSASSDVVLERGPAGG